MPEAGRFWLAGEEQSARHKAGSGRKVQYGFFNTSVFNNRQGNPDTLQTDDDIRYNTYTVFTNAD